MKHLAVIAFALAIGGCANHANFEQPDSYKVIGDQFNQQTLYYEVRYSQPYPGVFNGNEQQPMAPIDDIELSVVSRKSLANTKGIIDAHLPAGITTVQSRALSDYIFDVEITARRKQGPTAWDFEFLKSFGVGLLTFGLGPDYWDIIADFDVKYALTREDGSPVYSKSYNISAAFDHRASPFDTLDPLYRANRELYEQQLRKTLNSFFEGVEEQSLIQKES
jgi:hypothetical protein